MTNFSYVFPRLVRHFLPNFLVRFLLRKRWIIRPGVESFAPHHAVEDYLDALEDAHVPIQGKSIMVFGYGGRFAVGCMLLKAGAKHVTLVDPFAPPENQENQALLPEYSDYLQAENGQVVPRPEFITLVSEDIRDKAVRQRIGEMDIILSRSVFEHVDDVKGITRALTSITALDGLHIHFIDLRDHYFKYPFEMLTFSNSTWKRWLNPTSNLNRYRIQDYQRVFEHYYYGVNIKILDRQVAAFEKVRPRIHPEFLTGDVGVDAATLMRVNLSGPRRNGSAVNAKLNS